MDFTITLKMSRNTPKDIIGRTLEEAMKRGEDLNKVTGNIDHTHAIILESNRSEGFAQMHRGERIYTHKHEGGWGNHWHRVNYTIGEMFAPSEQESIYD